MDKSKTRRAERHVLIISDQDVLRAGNQILFRTIEGYLAAGFRVSFITNQKDDANVAETEELFGQQAERVHVYRFPITFHTVRQRLIGRGWLNRLQRLRRVLKPTTVHSALFPPVAEDDILTEDRAYADAGLLRRLNHWLFNYHAYRTATRLARTRRIDVVYGFEAMACEVAGMVAAKLAVPLCTRFQGTFILWRALNSGTAESLYPLRLGGTRVPANLHIVSNDGTRGDEVLLRLGHPSDRILFLVDGVRKDICQPDTDRAAVFAEYGIAIRESTRTILTLSKLDGWKRHDRIIGAMPAILHAVPDAYLVIAHRGEIRQQLEEYAHRLGVSHRVIFTGPIPHTQVYRLLNTCDLYVNSNDLSNLSHPVMEALVCGKPVVSIDDGSLDGIVTHGENGVLVSLPHIRDELPTQVAALLKDDSRRREMSHKARRFAETTLRSWEERMKVEVERVESLLGEPRPVS